MNQADPRCPECGEPIGITATYCMHCSADLTDHRDMTDTDNDGFRDDPAATPTTGDTSSNDWQGWFHPDSILDNSLTILVGLVGGFVVGLVATFVVLALTDSGLAVVLGILVWLGATIHLVTRRTVKETIVKTAYGIAIVLALVPLVVFSPSNNEAAFGERIVLFLVMLGGVAIPAAIVAGIGFAISRYSPMMDEE